ncbi:MAG: hypothetical protein ABTQ31_04565 [Rhizobiaceae bacterium]
MLSTLAAYALTPAGKAVGVLCIAGGLFGVGYAWGRLDGRAIAQASIVERIGKENAHAGSKAEDWRGALRDCDARGGVFDFATGTCDR